MGVRGATNSEPDRDEYEHDEPPGDNHNRAPVSRPRNRERNRQPGEDLGDMYEDGVETNLTGSRPKLAEMLMPRGRPLKEEYMEDSESEELSPSEHGEGTRSERTLTVMNAAASASSVLKHAHKDDVRVVKELSGIDELYGDSGDGQSDGDGRARLDVNGRNHTVISRSESGGSHTDSQNSEVDHVRNRNVMSRSESGGPHRSATTAEAREIESRHRDAGLKSESGEPHNGRSTAITTKKAQVYTGDASGIGEEAGESSVRGANMGSMNKDRCEKDDPRDGGRWEGKRQGYDDRRQIRRHDHDEDDAAADADADAASRYGRDGVLASRSTQQHRAADRDSEWGVHGRKRLQEEDSESIRHITGELRGRRDEDEDFLEDERRSVADDDGGNGDYGDERRQGRREELRKGKREELREGGRNRMYDKEDDDDDSDRASADDEDSHGCQRPKMMVY